MHRRIRLVSAAFAALTILLLCSFAAGSAAAGEITVTAPSSPAAVGETVTLPVIMTGAEDIAGVTFEIANNVPGVTITVNDAEPITKGTYLVNSDLNNQIQKIVWFSSSGITRESIEIFSLDVVVSSSAAASVPIVITPVTIVNSNSGFLTDKYPVIPINIQLTDTTVGNVMMEGGNIQSSQTAAPTQIVPTQTTEKKDKPAEPTPAATNPQKTETPTTAKETPMPTQSTPQSTPAIPGTPQAQPVKTASAASPLGLLPLIGFAAAAIIIGRKERIV